MKKKSGKLQPKLFYNEENIENKFGQNYYRREGNDRQCLRFELLQLWGALSIFFT